MSASHNIIKLLLTKIKDSSSLTFSAFTAQNTCKSMASACCPATNAPSTILSTAVLKRSAVTLTSVMIAMIIAIASTPAKTATVTSVDMAKHSTG
jgi:hypothetical protein